MEEENIIKSEENNKEESISLEDTAQDEDIPCVEEEESIPPKVKAKAKPKAKEKVKVEAEPIEPEVRPAPKRRGRPKGSLNKALSGRVKPVIQEESDDDDCIASKSRSSYQNPPEKTISAIASLLQDFEERQILRQSKRNQFYSSFLLR